MTQTASPLESLASLPTRPTSHQVTFQGHAEDADRSMRHLVSGAVGVGARPVDRRITHSRPVRLCMPAGGQALLTVGMAGAECSTDVCTWVANMTITKPGRNGEDDVRLLSLLDTLPLTRWEVAQVRAQMPVTRALATHLGSNVFRGLALVCAIHHMRDFTAMIDALVACGADTEMITIIDKGYPYRLRNRVDGWLRHDLHVRLVAYPNRAEGLSAHLDRAAAAGAKTLVFDDGGYVLPTVLDHLPRRVGEIVGVVEQTMSGIWKLHHHEPLPVPVFSVAESALKAAVEAPYVAAAAINSVIERLPDEVWAGRPALVLGYGRIGRQGARLLRDVHRMRVAVYDNAQASLVTAMIDGFGVSGDLTTLIRTHRPLLVLGSAGRGSLTGDQAEAFVSSAYLASTTSRDYEFALDDWATRADRVVDYGTLGHGYLMPGNVELCVIGDGLPVNFHHRESTPNRIIDLVFAALLLGGATLASPDHGGHPRGRDIALVDQILADSPALDTYLQRYGDDAAPRDLLTPPAGDCPDYRRSPWTYGGTR